MNSRLFTQGCPRTISWTCQPSNTCGRWTVCSSGGMSSWRPAWGSSPDGPTESSSSSSASVKDVTDSPKSVCLRNGEYRNQTKTIVHFHVLHAYFFVCACVCVTRLWCEFVKGGSILTCCIILQCFALFSFFSSATYCGPRVVAFFCPELIQLITARSSLCMP